MKEKIIHIQYGDEKSILIVTNTGKIKQLFTPFKVICVEAVVDIPIKTKLYVIEVYMTEKDKLVYLILGKLYFHSYFIII